MAYFDAAGGLMERSWFAREGDSDGVLLISCLGDDTGGGLFAYDGRAVTQIDSLSTTGLWVDDNRLLRVLWCSSEAGSSTDLIDYDSRGIRHYHRLDGVSDPHDVLLQGDDAVIVSTSTNSLVWVSPSGEVRRRWHASGNGDAWHLNSLLACEGDLLVCAFGKFDQNRGWAGEAHIGAGIVFNPRTGANVITGLSCPHTPRVLEDGWLICNSATRELLYLDRRTCAIRRRLSLDGWTRGVAVCDHVFFVGESGNRTDPEASPTASIAVVDRETWAVIDRIPLPCREVYDLVIARPVLVEGTRRGFRTNPQRVAEQDQLALFDQIGVRPSRLWAVGDPLPANACRVRINATFPEQLEAGTVAEVGCTVENQGSAALVSAPPNPVNLSYKWLDPNTGHALEELEGIRTRLPRTLLPRHDTRCRAKVQAPPHEGQFILRITLVQELVAWFDDLAIENQCSNLVRVVRRTEPG